MPNPSVLLRPYKYNYNRTVSPGRGDQPAPLRRSKTATSPFTKGAPFSKGEVVRKTGGG
ncbi:MAG: hypothetical protein QGI86_03895 [Candidatus Poribacteria bacterium]|nr:hypothetical protein [Candidatus Poribacteria bacterium]MDP6747960.1 hypothetical protein [Candidatus Poribacteria bacterium]MDP6995550.1 hypothetical protein [Candidatus Poribacteria bacterium]